jgi:hypothetical protein
VFQGWLAEMTRWVMLMEVRQRVADFFGVSQFTSIVWIIIRNCKHKVPRSYSQAEENACLFTDLGMTNVSGEWNFFELTRRAADFFVATGKNGGKVCSYCIRGSAARVFGN